MNKVCSCVSYIELSRIIEEYEHGFGVADIAESRNITSFKLRKLLEDAGVKVKIKSRKYVNDDF